MNSSSVAPLSNAVFFILLALADGEKHGYAIMRSIRELSEDGFRLGPAMLYSTIQKLVEQGSIEETEGDAEADSRRRYYRLTGTGRRALELELARMESVLRQAKSMRLKPVVSR